MTMSKIWDCSWSCLPIPPLSFRCILPHLQRCIGIRSGSPWFCTPSSSYILFFPIHDPYSRFHKYCLHSCYFWKYSLHSMVAPLFIPPRKISMEDLSTISNWLACPRYGLHFIGQLKWRRWKFVQLLNALWMPMAMVIIVLYVIARIVFLVLPCIALWALHPTTFIKTDCAALPPYIGWVLFQFPNRSISIHACTLVEL